MNKLLSIFCVLATALVLGGCNPSEDQPQDEATVDYEGGVFVLCEGSFGAGNSSLYHYYPESKEVTANVFHSANDARLGDIAQSLYMYNGLLFVVVNNSGVVFALDRTTGKVEGMIDDLLSPRFIAIDGTGTKCTPMN